MNVKVVDDVLTGPRDSSSRGACDASSDESARGSADREGLADGPASSARSRARRESQRAETARLRDVTAGKRDLAADLRDRRAEEEEEALLGRENTRDGAIRALLAASGVVRDNAAADRADAASDRHLAAADRASASAESGQARVELEIAHLDCLTGAYTRDVGRATLEHAIERSRRSGRPFALAFVDVDGLKDLNDRAGHAAGDELLQAVAVALKAQLRSYDPMVRVGGDEFICGFTDTTLEASQRRVEEIRAALERGPVAASISVGLAILGDRDTLEKLIARADADMYSRKQRGRAGT
jgi:diguanylate cyclase (GGDEF)-like protein